MYAKLTFRNFEFIFLRNVKKTYFLHTKTFGVFPNNHYFCRKIITSESLNNLYFSLF